MTTRKVIVSVCHDSQYRIDDPDAGKVNNIIDIIKLDEDFYQRYVQVKEQWDDMQRLLSDIVGA